MVDGDYYQVKAAYREAFGVTALDWCNDFALDPDEVIQVLKRALHRGSPAADEEIEWLQRNVQPNVFY